MAGTKTIALTVPKWIYFAKDETQQSVAMFFMVEEVADHIKAARRKPPVFFAFAAFLGVRLCCFRP
jgi:hypothetical protein